MRGPFGSIGYYTLFFYLSVSHSVKGDVDLPGGFRLGTTGLA